MTRKKNIFKTILFFLIIIQINTAYGMLRGYTLTTRKEILKTIISKINSTSMIDSVEDTYASINHKKIKKKIEKFLKNETFDKKSNRYLVNTTNLNKLICSIVGTHLSEESSDTEEQEKYEIEESKWIKNAGKLERRRSDSPHITEKKRKSRSKSFLYEK